MAYTYTDGDGLTALVKTEPNGATEPVSNLDDAVRQIKAYMRDDTGGLALIRSQVTTAMADIDLGEVAIAAIEVINTAQDSKLADYLARIITLESRVASVVTATPASAPVTAVIIPFATQAIDAGAGATLVNYDTKALDTVNAYNTTDKAFTAPTAGLYQVIASLGITTSASSSPVTLTHTLEAFIGAAVAAAETEEVGTSVAARTLRLVAVFQLSLNQVLTFKYTGTVASGTHTTTLVADATRTLLQITRITL